MSNREKEEQKRRIATTHGFAVGRDVAVGSSNVKYVDGSVGEVSKVDVDF